MNESVEQDKTVNSKVEQGMNSIGVLKADQDQLPKASIDLVRGLIRPMLFYLVEQGVEISGFKSPEEIITRIAEDQNLNLDENLKSELENYYPDVSRDWNLEASSIALKPHGHPLLVLSSKVVGKLSPPGKLELTRAEMFS